MGKSQLVNSKDGRKGGRQTAVVMTSHAQSLKLPTNPLTKKVTSTSSFFVEGSDAAVKFEDIPEISPEVLENLSRNDWTKMSVIQSQALPLIFNNEDVLAAAPTGSGKTLAFVVPAWCRVFEEFDPEARRKKGSTPFIVIITPTRELANQILDVALAVGAGLGPRLGLLIGGTDKKKDVDMIHKGIDFCIGTPGRLLDHVQNTQSFALNNVGILIIDEADRIFEIGFKDQLNALLDVKNGLPQKRQTLLFSATLTEEVRFLARNNLKRNAKHIAVESTVKRSTHIEQAYMLLPLEDRLVFLYYWLKKMAGVKAMVFFSSCSSVHFHEQLFKTLEISVTNKDGSKCPAHEVILSLHGKKKQANRMRVIQEFQDTSSGILFCTDVAARGLDLPSVEWILQFDPPSDPKDYIHRIGRTGRGVGADGVEKEGKTLMILQPLEVPLLEHLKAHQVSMDRVSLNYIKFEKLGKQLRSYIQKHFALHKLAKEGYKGFVYSYNAHYLKDCYNIAELDLEGVAKAFGLAEHLHINLGVKPKRRKHAKAARETIQNKHEKISKHS